MTGYTFLTDQDLAGLQRQRLRTLEIDHFREVLALREEPRDEQAFANATELWRRILLHRDELGLSATAPGPDDAVEMPAEGEPPQGTDVRESDGT